ncbi:carboxymuconolactone decarboxylase [Burkholderia pseudomallei MSHR6137]|nr:carboxymuconolactone decarboxylase [Burkholderia pseudomallei MSHR6137]
MALPQSYRELTSEVATQMCALRKTQPDLMSAFAALAAAGTKEGALGKKTRELVALGIAIASRCDDCIGFHVQTLVKLGTTREEFEDLSATAVYMGGGPSMMYAAHALRAVEEFGGSDGGWPTCDGRERRRSDIQMSATHFKAAIHLISQVWRAVAVEAVRAVNR